MHPFYRILLYITGVSMLTIFCWQCRLMPYHKSELYGLWLGVHIEYIPNFPLPVLNEFRTDGTVITKRLGEDAKHYNWALNGDILTVDTLHYDLIKCDKNTLQTKKNYNYLFRRIKDTPVKKDEGELRAFLRNTSWVSGDKILHFDNEKVYTFAENKLIETRCWNIEKYGDYAFLYQTGHHMDCGESVGRVTQIIAAKDNRLHLSTWNEIGKNDLIYTKQNNVADFDNLLKNSTFQRCNMYGIYQIGHTGNLYEGGGAALKNYFNDNYKPTKNTSNENGFIVIEFIINCAGEIGELEVIEIDKNYKAHQFHEDVTRQLVDIIKSIHQWIPYEADGINRDARTDINFRIVNGNIKVIL